MSVTVTQDTTEYREVVVKVITTGGELNAAFDLGVIVRGAYVNGESAPLTSNYLGFYARKGGGEVESLPTLLIDIRQLIGYSISDN